MENDLFRKKSLEHISSPESLHDYMRVTSPRLWMILGAIAVLLIGLIVYAATARLENTLDMTFEVTEITFSDVPGKAREGDKYCLVVGRLPISYMDIVKTGMKVRIGKNEGQVDWITALSEENAISIGVTMDGGYFEQPENAIVKSDPGEDAIDSIYMVEGVLVLESATPISFLWN